MPTNAQLAPRYWDGVSVPHIGQHLTEGIRISRIYGDTMFIRNFTEGTLQYTVPRTTAQRSLRPNLTEQISLRTGEVIRSEYRSSYPRGDEAALPFYPPVINPEPFSVPVVPVENFDSHCPWRPFSVDGSGVLDSATRLWINYVNPAVDYLQPHPVQLISVSTEFRYVAFGLENGFECPWQQVAYSKAYQAFVLASDMRSGGGRYISVRRDELGYYYIPQEGASPVPVKWYQAGDSGTSPWATLSSIEQYYADNSDNPEAILTVSNQCIQGLRIQSNGIPFESQWPRTPMTAVVTSRVEGSLSTPIPPAPLTGTRTFWAPHWDRVPEVGWYLYSNHALRVISLDREAVTVQVYNDSSSHAVAPVGNMVLSFYMEWAPWEIKEFNYISFQSFETITQGRGVSGSMAPKRDTEAQKQKATKDLMLQLIETRSLKQAEGMIQCGLEFEFHALNGKKRGEFVGEIDEVRLKEVMDRYIQASCGLSKDDPQFTAKYLIPNRIWPSQGRRDILRGLLTAGLGLDALSGEVRATVEADISQVRAAYLEEVRQNHLRSSNRTDYMTNIGITGWEKIAPYTQIGDDGSVQGGEIRTIGPRSIPEVLTAAKVLSENDFLVGENTSLHIHLSVKGITHAYGQRFQAEMYAYLLRNLHRIPDSVRKRMVAEKGCRSYAKLLLGTEKYSAIHFHKKYGTWEFRLFGNTKNYVEMRTCLQLAYEALKHAYSVKLGKSESLLGSVTTDQIQRVLEKLMANPEKFWDTLATDTRMVIESGAA